MKNLIIITSLFLLAHNLFSQPNITLQASLQKEVFLLHEPIDLWLAITNTGDSIYKDYFASLIRLNVLNEQNEPQKYIGRVLYDWSGLFLTLKPGEFSYPVFNLVDLYGEVYKISPVYVFMPEGKYLLELSFHPPDADSQIIRLPFQIEYPEGSEAAVYEGILSIITKQHTAVEKISKYESLYQTYPNSVYTPFLLIGMHATYTVRYNDTQKGLSLIGELIENYPNSSSAVHLTATYLKSMSNDQERFEFLKKLKLKTAGEISNRFYDSQIQYLEERNK